MATAGTVADLDAPPELEMEFPPKPEYVRTVRQAVAALARLQGADDDLVEDIKIAVSEACTTALRVPGDQPLQPVELRSWGGEEGLRIAVADPQGSLKHEVSGPPEELPTEDLPFEQALALPIIRGLVDDFAIAGREGGGTVMRMLVSLDPAMSER